MSKIICLDFGHGESDPGSIGKNGTYEKNINLSIGLKVNNYLKQNNFKVVLTRDGDNVSWNSANINEDLRERVKIANNANSDAFVSIHCNSATNRTAKGFEIYSTRGQNNSDKLTTKIHSRVKSTFPNLVYREDFSDGDVDKEAGYYVIKNTNMVSTLIETLFISNLEEEKLLNNPDFQDKIAFAIAQGIGDYFGIEIKRENSNTPKVKVGDKIIECIIVENQTYAPIREIGELLGFPVVYNSQTKEVTVGGVKIDKIIIDSVSYAPVRYLAESLDYTVQWDNENKIVIITK